MEPARLVRILKAVSEEELSVSPAAEAMQGHVELSAGREFSAVHGTLPADDFPLLHVSDPGWEGSLPRSAVDTMLRVAAAMSTEETRYYLNGVYFHHVQDWTFRFAATDGHRLYYADVEIPDATGEIDGSGAHKGIIIPRKAIGLISRLRSRTADEPITFSLRRRAESNEKVDWSAAPGANLARFEFKAPGGRHVTLTTKLIDGTFPDYSRVIPAEETVPSRFTVRSADLRRIAHALAGTAPRQYRALKLRLLDKSVEVAAKYVDFGFSGGFTIPAEVNQDGVEIGFNGRYLISVLNSLESEEVTFMIGGEAGPVRVVDPAGNALSAVLMPMRM